MLFSLHINVKMPENRRHLNSYGQENLWAGKCPAELCIQVFITSEQDFVLSLVPVDY